MFAAKLSAVAALALSPFTQAIFLQLPVGWQSSSPANISWTHAATDQAFTLQLVNTNTFHNTFSIANNVDPTKDFDAFTLPVIPQGTYTLQAINVGNQSDVFDQTPDFTIQGPPDSSTLLASSTVSSSGASNSTAASSRSSSVTTPASSGTAAGATSTSGFGHTVSNTNTGTTTPASAGTSATDSGSPATTTGGFNTFNGASPLVAPWVAGALALVAGAAAAL